MQGFASVGVNVLTWQDTKNKTSK